MHRGWSGWVRVALGATAALGLGTACAQGTLDAAPEPDDGGTGTPGLDASLASAEASAPDARADAYVRDAAIDATPDAAVDAGPSEPCNGLDDNGNGQVDEGCPCTPGDTQACYAGPPALAGKGACVRGKQTCAASGSGGAWGACVGGVLPTSETCNGADDDCNDKVDDLAAGCVTEMPVNTTSDCVTVRCPASAPHPVGCSLVFAGNDDRGCVANTPNDPEVYFKEGNNCGAGQVGGKLLCSTKAGSGLNAANCPINKATRYYPATSAGCPSGF